MSIIQQIRTARHGFHVALLLVCSMLNAVHFQSVAAMSMSGGSVSPHSADVGHAVHTEAERPAAGGHVPHAAGEAADCGPVDACKAKCAWFCQLAQAVEPPTAISPASIRVAVRPPVYYPHIQSSSPVDLTFRPPISV